MICVNISVSEKRRCFVCIYTFLIVEMFYSFESCFTLFDLPLYSFPSIGVNRSGVCVQKEEIVLFWEQHKNNPLMARNQILASLCPQVYGLYVVKMAVALCLAGGVEVREHFSVF